MLFGNLQINNIQIIYFNHWCTAGELTNKSPLLASEQVPC